MSAAMTPEAREIMAYLKKHNLAEQLNMIVNKLCKRRSDDPFGFLSSKLHTLAAPPVITKVDGREIFSSTGLPTVQVDVYCKVDDMVRFVASGCAAASSSSSSSSSGKEEEKKDGNEKVQKAVTNISEVIHSVVSGMKPKLQDQCDAVLEKNKAKIGQQPITATSIAICKAAASLKDVECFTHIRSLIKDDGKETSFKMPKPMVQLIRGGAYGCNLEFAEVLVYPTSGKSFQAQLKLCARLHNELGNIIAAKFGEAFRAGCPSGGYSPPLADLSEALKLVSEAATAAGLDSWNEVGLAVNGGTWEGTGYVMKQKDKAKGLDEAIQFYVGLAKDNPGLKTLINPLNPAVDHAAGEGWSKLTATLSEDEDLKANTYTLISESAGKEQIKTLSKVAANVSLKVENSVTLTEATNLVVDMMESKLDVTVSGGEDTNDTFVADFAVGVGARFAKFGGLLGSQNVDKYNRLLQIEASLS
mmetsp:Transcript_13286/g.15804  ORF Transcript_13286/g.15804 Transcript_13286/m.15804 type:complete len:473 (-) Transcript_13286:110-1528(-)|eukprot:jgi/Bigna1/91743/estExt_fgenesh1_pg.C_1160034